jgi:hypothetical protein
VDHSSIFIDRRLKRWARRLRARYFLSFVFIHINKTAGTSISRALRLPIEHKTALEKRAELGPRVWARRFSFAIVRNPWDKVVSHYHYRVKTNQTRLGSNPRDFNEWVRLAYGENAPEYYDNPKMFMPQWDWISDEQSALMVGFVGRFETLQEDFDTICARIHRKATLPHENYSERGDYRKHYNDDSAEIVRRWFAPDIAHFGYTFD